MLPLILLLIHKKINTLFEIIVNLVKKTKKIQNNNEKSGFIN